MFLPADFFKKYGSAFISACIGTPIFPSVKAAQAALETGYGKSIAGNNLFGIKASGKPSPYWKGAQVESETTEVVNGKAGKFVQPFRAYVDPADSVRDHSHFLMVNPRYKAAGVLSAKTPAEQARAIQAAGYATDPEYANKIISIIQKYRLDSLDKKKKQVKRNYMIIAAVLILAGGYIFYQNFR